MNARPLCALLRAVSRIRVCPYWVLILAAVVESPQSNAANYRTVVLTGESAPPPGRIVAHFDALGTPAINHRGQVAFLGELTTHIGPSWDGIWLTGSNGATALVANSESVFQTSSGSFNLDRFSPPLLNDAGEIAFTSVSGGNSRGTARSIRRGKSAKAEIKR
jgi:hypothetical protein